MQSLSLIICVMLSDVKLQYLTYLTCGREREERRDDREGEHRVVDSGGQLRGQLLYEFTC